MIRDVNFLGGGGVGGKGGWHLVMSLWLSEQSGMAVPGETLLNLLGLLLHLPVNEHCCWRYPCVPCHEASRHHLHLTLWPRRKMAAAVTDVFTVRGREPWETCTVRGPGCIGGNNCYNMCLPQSEALFFKAYPALGYILFLIGPSFTKSRSFCTETDLKLAIETLNLFIMFNEVLNQEFNISNLIYFNKSCPLMAVRKNASRCTSTLEFSEPSGWRHIQQASDDMMMSQRGKKIYSHIHKLTRRKQLTAKSVKEKSDYVQEKYVSSCDLSD